MTSTSQDRIFGANSSLAIKAPVRIATTANITLSGLQSIDGVTTVAEDRVLVKDQTDATENGIYIATTSTWQRAPDFDGNRDIVTGTLVAVIAGTVNQKTMWRVSTTGTITIDTTSIAFEQAVFSNSSSVAFQQAPAASVVRTVQDVLRERISLEDFGAVGDYDWVTQTGTDDSVAVQLAIDTVGALGGGIIHASRGKKYLVSQITCNYAHVLIQGENPAFNYRNDGIDSPTDYSLTKDSCALVVKSGVFGIHFRQDLGVGGTHGVGAYSGLKDIAVICDLVSTANVEYGVVISAQGTQMENVHVDGFKYGITCFNQNMNAYKRVAVTNNTYIGFLVASAAGATRIVSAYQHPNLNAFLPDGLTSSTIYAIEKIVARGNFIGVAILNAETAKLSGVIESNRAHGLVLFKKTDHTFDGLEVDCHIENNFSGFTGANAADYEIDGTIAVSPTAPGPITGLKTSSTEWLKGSTSGEWSNAGDDVPPMVWIGSETESVTPQHVANAKHPYNVTVRGDIHCQSNNQRALYARSSENLKLDSIITAGGSATKLIVLHATLALGTHIHDTTFDGNGATFETNVVEAGLLGGTGTYVTRPERSTTLAGGEIVLQGAGVKNSGSFTGTLTGGTTSPTGTVQWSRSGNTVTLHVPAFTATSNATSKTITGMPSKLFPAAARNGNFWGSDNGGANAICLASVGTDGVISIFNGVGNWTNSGTFANVAFTMSYPLN